MLGQHFLDLLAVQQLGLCQPQDHEGLLAGHKPALDTEALIGDFGAARVLELLREGLVVLLLEVVRDNGEPFLFCQGADVFLILFIFFSSLVALAVAIVRPRRGRFLAL